MKASNEDACEKHAMTLCVCDEGQSVEEQGGKVEEEVEVEVEFEVDDEKGVEKEDEKEVGDVEEE